MKKLSIHMLDCVGISAEFKEQEKPESLNTMSQAQPVKEAMISIRESWLLLKLEPKARFQVIKKGASSRPHRQLFQIHGSEFKPDPVGNSGQASMVGITHAVLFLSISERSFLTG